MSNETMICDNLNIENLDGEIWNDIVGFDGTHSVSNFGRVKRELMEDTRGRLLKPKIIKRQYFTGKDGYVDGAKVGWGANNKTYKQSVSVLVATSFIGEIPKGHCVVHLDKNIKNDTLENLKIMPYSDSLKIDYIKKNKKDWGFGQVGNVGKNKIIQQLDLSGQIVNEFNSLGEIQRKLGYCKSSISGICNGRHKDKPHYTAYGFFWQFKLN